MINNNKNLLWFYIEIYNCLDGNIEIQQLVKNQYEIISTLNNIINKEPKYPCNVYLMEMDVVNIKKEGIIKISDKHYHFGDYDENFNFIDDSIKLNYDRFIHLYDPLIGTYNK